MLASFTQLMRKIIPPPTVSGSMVKPLATAEARRLAADESDWNLVGGGLATIARTRTRGGNDPSPEEVLTSQRGLTLLHW
jgi:hypothetical protein